MTPSCGRLNFYLLVSQSGGLAIEVSWPVAAIEWRMNVSVYRKYSVFNICLILAVFLKTVSYVSLQRLLKLYSDVSQVIEIPNGIIEFVPGLIDLDHFGAQLVSKYQGVAFDVIWYIVRHSKSA